MRKSSWGLDWQWGAWNGIKGIAFYWLMVLFRETELFTYSHLLQKKITEQNTAKQQKSSYNKKGLYQRIITPEPTWLPS